MRFAVFAAAFALAACEGEPERSAEESPAPAPAATFAPPSAVALEPLGEADLATVDLSGELACSFRREAAAAPIWLGRGDVDPAAGAEAVVKLGGAVRKLTMDDDAMADGARFEGEGVTLAIARSGDEPTAEQPQIAMESPTYPAVMTVSLSGRDERTIQGLFECGP